MGEVETYIWNMEDENQKELMIYFHQFLVSLPFVSSKIRFHIPFYRYKKNWFCYLSPKKNGTIEFVFLKGYKLSNEQGILEANGRKQVAGIIFDTIEEGKIASLKEVVQEAFLLD